MWIKPKVSFLLCLTIQSCFPCVKNKRKTNNFLYYLFQERCAILRRWSDLCNQQKPELARLLTCEMVRPLLI
jgi:hypothetical protein